MSTFYHPIAISPKLKLYFYSHLVKIIALIIDGFRSLNHYFAHIFTYMLKRYFTYIFTPLGLSCLNIIIKQFRFTASEKRMLHKSTPTIVY